MFKPEDIGFIKTHDDDEYVLIKDMKVVAALTHLDYAQGLNIEYILSRVIHCTNGEVKFSALFSGRIPSVEFANELIKNTL